MIDYVRISAQNTRLLARRGGHGYTTDESLAWVLPRAEALRQTGHW